MAITKVGAFLVCFQIMLLLLQTPSVEAATIMGYVDEGVCTGLAVACYNVPPNQCCLLGTQKWITPSVKIILYPGQAGDIFTGYTCSRFRARFRNTYSERSWYCFTELVPITAGRWFRMGSRQVDSANQESLRTSGLPDAGVCTSTTLPNAVMYSVPGASNQTWVLETDSDKVDDMLVQLQNVPLEHKENWLKGMGAHLEEDSEQQLKMLDGSLNDMYM